MNISMMSILVKSEIKSGSGNKLQPFKKFILCLMRLQLMCQSLTEQISFKYRKLTTLAMWPKRPNYKHPCQLVLEANLIAKPPLSCLSIVQVT